MPEPVIRRYRAGDREHVYEVCARTAAAGGDARGVYRSDDLMPDVFAGPYLELEPELAFVVDDGARVSGYIIATADTRVFVDRLRRHWLPGFAEMYPNVVPPQTPDDQIAHLGHTPERMLIPEVDDYPAHLHIDLLTHLQGRGIGRALIERLRSELAARGVRGLHLSMDPANLAARAFYERIGFHELPSSTAEQPRFGIPTAAAVGEGTRGG